MASQKPTGDAEALLEQWLRERDENRSQVLIESLVRYHAEPLIRRIVSFKLDSGRRESQRADVDDVSGTALYNLLARLDRVKRGAQEPAIRDLAGYTAVTAYNACNEYFRAKKPERRRLAMKLRYLATHSPRVGLWQTPEGYDVCGFARDRGREAAREPSHLSAVCTELLRTGQRFRKVDHLNLADLVESIFEAAGAPLILDDLVDVVAELTGIKEARIESLDEDFGERSHRREVVDSKASSEARLSAGEYGRHLWKEICELPLEHRRALLLNLEDSAGGDIQLFDFLGIATIRQIAVTLEMDPLVFAELWKRLPLDDAAIARELGLSRQDVANRRSSARKRLARRMMEYERGG